MILSRSNPSGYKQPPWKTFRAGQCYQTARFVNPAGGEGRRKPGSCTRLRLRLIKWIRWVRCGNHHNNNIVGALGSLLSSDEKQIPCASFSYSHHNAISQSALRISGLHDLVHISIKANAPAMITKMTPPGFEP